VTIPFFDLAHAALALRCFGCLMSLPLGEALTAFPRFLLAVGLGLLIFPLERDVAHLPPLTLLTEFVIGFVLGAPLRCVADVSEMIGELLDTARGQTISAVLDPLNGHSGSDLATVLKISSVVVALMSGALEVVVGALARSIEVVPLGSPAFEGALIHGVASSGAFLLGEGMRLCAVWVGAFLLIDITCSILSRVMRGLAFTQTAALLKMMVLFLLLLMFLSQRAGPFSTTLARIVSPWGWKEASPPAEVVSHALGRLREGGKGGI
jgi:flagellar biosynthesis protein FliR